MSSKRYRIIDLIGGWGLFVIASLVYLLTMEPTASYWDCGEFIACANKLMVGHPPGAPFFMLLVRLFTLFAPSPEYIGVLANSMSALASGATIMFLYWTIAHFARRMHGKPTEELTVWDTVRIVGAGAIGALCYTFSDTFWFSAVEGEVYALSSLFTAVVFWAVLKWENEVEKPQSARWIVLIAYLMGLSIGVHLLNLLAIPAIVLIFYFKNYKYTHWGLIKALLLGAALLLIVLYGVIQGLVAVAAYSDLFFVNSLGAPLWSGAIVFTLLFGAAVVAGIWITHKKRKAIANTVLLCLAMLLLGYSSYAVILIRSDADPTLDQNGVDNLFALKAYLNREQYGDRPLITGPYYNSTPVATKEGGWVYAPRNGKYEKVRQKFSLKYDDRMTTLFPRMWSSEQMHVQGYQSWVGTGKRPVQAMAPNGQTETVMLPSFGDNLRFFFNYQLGYMYWRYFFWNFAGRQNDFQGFGRDIYRGNWISGIPFIDNARLGNQELLPDKYRDNPGRNRYYMLPLLLGLLGMFYHFRKNPKHAGVVLCLFILTGIAIVVYLNQKPYEPRERDYSFAGSFYAYAIWVGLGIYPLAKGLAKAMREKAGTTVALGLSLVAVPGLMASENWDDHDRSGRYTANDFARNMLTSCGEHGILFVYADNDTFPLWYALEAEEFRTDLRICNLTYLGADWYVDVMARKAYESDPLPFNLPREKYWDGVNDRVEVRDAIARPVDLDEAMKFVLSDDPRTKVRNRYLGEEYISFFPSKRLYQTLNKQEMQKCYPEQFTQDLPDTITFEPGTDALYRDGFAVYALLNGNQWERPLYFSPMLPERLQYGLNRHFARKGLVQSMMPITHSPKEVVVDREGSYNMLMEEYSYRGVADSSVYLDETTRRMLQFYITAFVETTQSFMQAGDTVRAKKLVEQCYSKLPPSRVGWSYSWVDLINVQYQLGDVANARAALLSYANEAVQHVRHFQSLNARRAAIAQSDFQMAYTLLQYLQSVALQHSDQEAYDQISSWLGVKSGS